MKSLILIPLGLMSVAAHPKMDPSSYKAEVRGAMQVNLAGTAVFGPVRDQAGIPASFSLTLGAYSENGAVVFSRVGADRPKAGTYTISEFVGGPESLQEFHALVALGGPTSPLGTFRGMSGAVTITQSSNERIAGRYELKAVGFMATDAELENREITVRGSFSAAPSEVPTSFNATVRGSLEAGAVGDAEFGITASSEGTVFSLSMGAQGSDASILLSRSSAVRPAAGVYRLREVTGWDDMGFHGIVITGSPSHPTGVFQVRSGTLTITSSSGERLTGSFQLHAVGFHADSMDREDREITVTGSFSAVKTMKAMTLTLGN